MSTAGIPLEKVMQYAAPAVVSTAGPAVSSATSSLFRLPLTVLYAYLLVGNLATLWEIYMCKSFLRSTALWYLGMTEGLSWALVIAGVVYIVLSIVTGGALFIALEALGLNPVVVGVLVVLGIVWGSLNAVALAVVDQCQGGGSNRTTATLLSLGQIMLYGWWTWQSVQYYMSA